jgi:hypothetical protein
MAPPSREYTLIRFCRPLHDRYLGKATLRTPSGQIAFAAVYRDQGIYFGLTAADPDLFSGGSLEHEMQLGMRAALRDCYPELFIEEEP